MPTVEMLDPSGSRFRDMDQAARQLLLAALADDGKGVKIQRPDGGFDTYIVKRIKWEDE
jgi:hypothetical protein